MTRRPGRSYSTPSRGHYCPGSGGGSTEVAGGSRGSLERRHSLHRGQPGLPGRSSGQFVAYRADTGEQLWSFDAQTGVVAPPVSFRLDGTQYVAVVAGWVVRWHSSAEMPSPRVPSPTAVACWYSSWMARLSCPGSGKDAGHRSAGTHRLAGAGCPGVQGVFNLLRVLSRGRSGQRWRHPDLRALTPDKHAMWDSIVLGGLHWQYGMVGFGGELSKEQADAIHAYVIERATLAVTGRPGLQRIQIVKPVQRAAVIDFGERGSCAQAWR